MSTSAWIRGRIAGLSGTIACNSVLGRAPSTFRIPLMQEFDAKNRMQGTAGIAEHEDAGEIARPFRTRVRIAWTDRKC